MDILKELEKRAKAGSCFSINDTDKNVLAVSEAKNVFDLWHFERLQNDAKSADLSYAENKRNDIRCLRDLASCIESGRAVT